MKTLYLLLFVSALLCAQHTTPDGKVFSLYENPATGRLNIKIQKGPNMALVHMPDELADTHHPNKIAYFERDEFLWCVSGEDLTVLLKDEKADREHFYCIDCSDLDAVNTKTAPAFFHKQPTPTAQELEDSSVGHPDIAEQARRNSNKDIHTLTYSDLKKKASPQRELSGQFPELFSLIVSAVKKNI